MGLGICGLIDQPEARQRHQDVTSQQRHSDQTWRSAVTALSSTNKPRSKSHTDGGDRKVLSPAGGGLGKRTYA